MEERRVEGREERGGRRRRKGEGSWRMEEVKNGGEMGEGVR